MTPADVRTSAARIGAAEDAVRAASHPRHAADVAALAGSASAGSAARVAERWSAEVSSWAASAAAQSARMSAAVDDTQARDGDVAARLQRMASRLGATAQ
jgi:hypothetical protein